MLVLNSYMGRNLISKNTEGIWTNLKPEVNSYCRNLYTDQQVLGLSARPPRRCKSHVLSDITSCRPTKRSN